MKESQFRTGYTINDAWANVPRPCKSEQGKEFAKNTHDWDMLFYSALSDRDRQRMCNAFQGIENRLEGMTKSLEKSPAPNEIANLRGLHGQHVRFIHNGKKFPAKIFRERKQWRIIATKKNRQWLLETSELSINRNGNRITITTKE